MNFTNENSTTCGKIAPDVNCEFRCGSGECITATQKCNNFNDCASDEGDCAPTEKDRVNCRQNEFECLDGNQCVAIELRCDKTNDCNDKSDEADCMEYKKSSNECNKNQIPCSNGQCIDLKTVCEGWFERVKKSQP